MAEPVPEVQNLINEAAVRHRSGDHAGAAALYLRAQKLDPRNAAVLGNLGVMLRALGHHDKALLVLEKAATFGSEDAETLYNYGNALRDAGRIPEAVAHYRRVMALRPNLTGAPVNLSLLLGRLGHFQDAAEVARQGLLSAPHNPALWMNLGVARSELRQYPAALACFRRARSLNPDDPQAHNNLASALFALNRFEEALAATGQALTLAPEFAAAETLRGQCLGSLGRFDESLAAFKRALARQPDLLSAQMGRARVLLLAGRLDEGFAAYEARMRRVPLLSGPLDSPPWSGAEHPDATLLLVTEQGLGDSLMAIRFAALAARRVGRVVVQAPPILCDLLATADGVDEVVSLAGPPPPHHLHAPLLSLPHLLGVTARTLPRETPYLSLPDSLDIPQRPTSDRRLYVGLVWAGDSRHANDADRSCGLAALMPLLELPGIRFFSFQTGPARQQIADLGAFGLIEDLAPGLTDFSQTARFLLGMDLLISVDTAMVHLAGALDRPCWVLLPRVPDWRWMLDRLDSPWYRALSLYRQAVAGDWSLVVARLRDDLEAYQN
ncbi:tetratricopeptide repeat-containing glycosyltransferase family protein [Magnetospira thiophila]